MATALLTDQRSDFAILIGFDADIEDFRSTNDCIKRRHMGRRKMRVERRAVSPPFGNHKRIRREEVS
jgi:hypothetical protein